LIVAVVETKAYCQALRRGSRPATNSSRVGKKEGKRHPFFRVGACSEVPGREIGVAWPRERKEKSPNHKSRVKRAPVNVLMGLPKIDDRDRYLTQRRASLAEASSKGTLRTSVWLTPA